MNKQEDLNKYITNCHKVVQYKKTIAEYDKKIAQLNSLYDVAEPLELESVLDTAAKELHSLRIKRLASAIEVNKLEREILRFELAEELAD